MDGKVQIHRKYVTFCNKWLVKKQENVRSVLAVWLKWPLLFHEGGAWAAVGSTLGKLSGSENLVGDSYLIWGSLLGLMITANTLGCRFYLRSLDAASNSVAPTVISAASSYILSGIIGIMLFEETATWRWWLGSILIIFGLTLIARPRTKCKEKPT